jgi:hypothetical protein
MAKRNKAKKGKPSSCQVVRYKTQDGEVFRIPVLRFRTEEGKVATMIGMPPELVGTPAVEEVMGLLGLPAGEVGRPLVPPEDRADLGKA